jgi:hypothetical protein
VLATTSYPDDPNPGDYIVVKLNGLAAQDGALVLNKLADQLLVTGLNQSGLDATDGWQRLLAALRSAITTTACYFNKASISFKTGAVDVELGHSTDNPHC